MAVRVLMALAVLLALYGFGQSTSAPAQGEKEAIGKATGEGENEAPEPSRPEVPTDVPAYQVTKDEQGTLQGLRVRSMAATTAATVEKDLEAITRDLRAKSTAADVLLAYCYPNEPGATESGYGQAFASEEDGRTFLTAQYSASASANAEDELEEAMSNDGVFVVSFEEEVNEINQQVCDEWNVTTMGTPPPDMNCPGY